MKQFKTIFQFEIMNFLKNKIFIGLTIFFVAAIIAVMYFPRFVSFFEAGEVPESTEPEKPVLLLLTEEKDSTEDIIEAFSSSFEGYDVRFAENGLDDIKEQIFSGEAECAFALDSLTSYTYFVNNLSMYDDNTYQADELLKKLYRIRIMTESGISSEQAEQILSEEITHETESLGKDQEHNFLYTYIMILALYMVILLYGQMVATNVATEKSSRAMELLITSAKPVSMMFGKVIASCLAGLIQLICIFGSALLFFRLNQSYWSENPIIHSVFDMPANLFVYMLLFFVLGFFIYAFMYGAVGSMASKLEDINTLVMPITMLFLAVFFVVIYAMGSGDVDNVLMKICSYVPFSSPMAMFTRIAMSTVPWYEIVISVAILIGTVMGIGVLAAKIYRAGVLLYGKPPKLRTLLKR